jgi:hypothetical protein
MYRNFIAQKENILLSAQVQPNAPLKKGVLDFIDKAVELYEKEGRMPSMRVKTEVNLYQQWNTRYKYNPSVVQALEARGVDVNRTWKEQARADFVDKIVELYKEKGRMPSVNVKT